MVVTDARTVVIDAHTVELSNAEVTVRVATEALEGLAGIGLPFLEGTHVLIAFASERDKPARSAQVELVYPDPGEPFTLLTLAFLTPIDIAQLPGRKLVPAGAVTVTLDVVDPSSPDVLVRTLTALFEAFDASRVLTDQVLAKLDVDDQFALPAVTVSRLTMSSPLVVVLGGATAVLGFFRWQVRGILKLRQQWYEGSVTKSAAHTGEAEAVERIAGTKLSEAQARFLDEQTRALRTRNDRAERSIETDSTAAIAVLVRLLDQAVPDLPRKSLAPEDTDLISELFRNQVLPSLEKLLTDTLRSIEVKPDPALQRTLSEAIPDDADTGLGRDGDGRTTA